MKKAALLSLFLISFIFSRAQQFKLTLNQTTANTGDEYLGDCNLTVAMDNSVTGTILWSIVSIDKKNAFYFKNKMSATAIEYVRGSYAPESKTFSFSGYQKNDVSGIIGLDVYQISLVDNKRVSGKTRATGKWDGIVSGQYSATELPVVASVPEKVVTPEVVNKPIEVKRTGSEAEKYHDLLDKYLFAEFRGYSKPTYVPGSLGEVTVVSRSKNGHPSKVSAAFSFKTWQNVIGKTTVDVLYEDDLAYYMVYANNDWSPSEPFSGTVNSLADQKRITALQDIYNNAQEANLDALNKKNYAEIVKLFRSKYPTPINKKYLAVVAYDERVKKTGTVKTLVPAYDGDGNITTAEGETDKTYWEDEKRKGLKNVSNKTIVIMGLQRERLSSGEWSYTDISFTLAPGEVMQGSDIQPFYNPGEDRFSEVYFYTIR